MCRIIMIIFWLLISTELLAWDEKGHAAVGAIADENITEKAKIAVEKLLQSKDTASGRTTLASIASWADEIKNTPQGKALSPWHYRNNPVCQADILEPCPDGQCIDVKLEEQIKILKDKSASNQQQNEALKWLVHLVGDIHQPLHIAENNDRGANSISVILEGAPAQKIIPLHKAWDGPLVKQALIEPLNVRLPLNFEARQPSQWMAEGRKITADKVYGPLPGFSCGHQSPAAVVILDKTYQNNATRIIRQQISIAGQRLAAIINEIY